MRIKTILIPILASLALSSCIREVLPEEFAVAGLWAKVDDHSFAKQMVDIHDGIFHERDLMGDAKYVFEDAVWGCTEYSLSTGRKRDYSIAGNVLTIGDASYVLRREGDILCIGENRYKKYSIYEKQGYSEIVLENVRTSVPYTGADVDVAVEVLRRLPDAELTATTSHTWIKNLRLEGGHLRFTAEPSSERRTATVYLRCPGAIEQVFTIIQEKPGVIDFPQKEIEFSYKHQYKFITYTLSPETLDPETVTAASNADWLDVSLDRSLKRLTLTVTDNNSGADREAIVTIGCEGTWGAEIKVRQIYTGTVITPDVNSYSAPYKANTFYFIFRVSNPRDNSKFLARATQSWISDVLLSGYTVTAKIEANTGCYQREGSILVENVAENGVLIASVEIPVIQTHVPYDISLPTDVYANSDTQEVSFDVSFTNPQNSLELKVVNHSSFISSVRVGKSSISFNVSENHSRNSRTGFISLVYGSVEKSVSVHQDRFYTVGNAIDLGLPSGLLWSDMNLGSMTPDDTEFDYYDYPFLDSDPSLSWGEGWRTPSWDDWNELMKVCQWTVSTDNKYYIIKGPNGNSIKLQACGYLVDGMTPRNETQAHYWSSTPYEADRQTYQMAFIGDLNNSMVVRATRRNYRLLVRPVKVRTE